MIRFSHLSAAGAALFLVALVGCGGAPEGPPPTGGDAGAAGAGGAAPDVSAMAGLLKAPDPDKVVATVNGEPILAGRVYELAHVNKMRMLSEGQAVPEEMDQEILRGSLQLLVDGELMIQQARAEGMTVRPEEIDGQMEAVRSQFVTEEDYQKYLDNAGVKVEDLRTEAERRLLMQAYRQSVSAGQDVDEEQARRIYDEDPTVFSAGEEVRAASILIRSSQEDPAAKREEARQLIEKVHAELTEGGDFAELAKRYSQAPTADKGGDMGFFPRGVMVPRMEEVAFGTPVGETSPVFETVYGFNIIKILDKRQAKPRPFDDIKAWLMLQLVRQKEMAAVQAKLAELRAAATIEILQTEFETAAGEGGEAEGTS